MNPRKIVLTGMMCSGKTTVGRLLSRILGWRFIDTDSLIEKKLGKSIPQIFEIYGERSFREYEREVILELENLENVVIATGGGAILDNRNFKSLRKNSLMVYLHATEDEIVKRCGKYSRSRPLISENTDEKIRKILKERESVYSKVPVRIETTGKKPEIVAQKILYHLNFETQERVDGIENILIGPGRIKKVDEFLHGRSIFVIQRKVWRIFREFFEKEDVVLIPDGDVAKGLGVARKIYKKLMDAGIDRDGTLVSIGGGAASDLSGFIASTYKRGIKFINVPTTLLSQVDAGIGGKNALNFGRVKNVIGTFYHPFKIIIDPLALISLDSKAYRQGFAEIIKSAIIGDPGLIDFMEEHTDELLNRNIPILLEVIYRTVRVKMDIVKRDFEEKSGERKLLNLGHTFGHAYEVILGIYHGEAVALGLVKSLEIGMKLGLTDENFAKRIVELLDKFGLLRKLPEAENLSAELLTEKIAHDKKMRDGKVDFVVPVSPGKVVIKPLSLDEIFIYSDWNN